MAIPSEGPAPKRPGKPKKNARRRGSIDDETKRRCVSSACTACRRRKSKCDGNHPACAACCQVYRTECVYDLASDHRRKGVYKQDIDDLQTRNSTLTTLIEAILNYPQEDVPDLVRQIRTCDSLDRVAESISTQDYEIDDLMGDPARSDVSPFESRLSSKLGQLRLHGEGGARYYGGTSNLLFVDEDSDSSASQHSHRSIAGPESDDSRIASWTTVSDDPELIMHLLNMYFTWHFSFFVTLSRQAFKKHFVLGNPAPNAAKRLQYCSPLLVNAMLALGCHFSSRIEARDDENSSSTAGDHFFREAKRLLMEGEEYETPRLTTVQATALMSVREAGCGREAQGWAYSGIAFRMACDLGLNLDPKGLIRNEARLNEEEEDVRRMTFWGCFLFDKCWSNYLGRLPQFQREQNVTVPIFDVLPDEEATTWSPYTDSGFQDNHSQPSRTRAVALHLSSLCTISSDLMRDFYHPQQRTRPLPLHVEIKRLSGIQLRLEEWRKQLPAEFEPKDGALPSVFTMHMFYHLLYIHLFRYFLRYDPEKTALPPNVAPRKTCTQAAAMVSRLMRLYKRTYGLRQICNIVVYILHCACTIHLLNLPERNAKRDILHGVRHLQEISEGWPVAHRTLNILAIQAKRWEIEVPVEAANILNRYFEQQSQSVQADFGKSPEQGDLLSIDGLATPASGSLVADQATWNHGLTDQSMLNMDTSLDGSIGSLWGLSPQMPASPQQPLEQYRQQQMQQLLDLGRQRQALQQRMPSTQPLQPAASNIGSPFELISTPASFGSEPQIHPYQPQPTTQVPVPPQSREATLSKSTPRSGSQSPKSLQGSQRLTNEGQRPSLRQQLTADMFGGVDALLREGREWWFKDQSQVASGFGKWQEKS